LLRCCGDLEIGRCIRSMLRRNVIIYLQSRMKIYNIWVGYYNEKKLPLLISEDKKLSGIKSLNPNFYDIQSLTIFVLLQFLIIIILAIDLRCSMDVSPFLNPINSIHGNLPTGDTVSNVICRMFVFDFWRNNQTSKTNKIYSYNLP
jgi:hypothetical protein